MNKTIKFSISMLDEGAAFMLESQATDDDGVPTIQTHLIKGEDRKALFQAITLLTLLTVKGQEQDLAGAR